jgi:hypothetical protein
MVGEASNILWLPSVSDGAIEEAGHDSEALIRLVLQDAMGGILDCEDLGATTFEVLVTLDKLFWTTI